MEIDVIIGKKPLKGWEKAIEKLGKGHWKIRQNPSENGAKPIRKSSHIDRYKHGERSMLVLTPTVMNTSNGRCEITFWWVSTKMKLAFI